MELWFRSFWCGCVCHCKVLIWLVSFNLWFDCPVKLIALMLAARWCFYSGCLGGAGERSGKRMDGGVGLILSVTLSRFVRHVVGPPFFTLFLQFNRPQWHSLWFEPTIWASHSESIFLNCLFFIYLPLLQSLSLLLSASLSRIGLICNGTNRLIVFL